MHSLTHTFLDIQRRLVGKATTQSARPTWNAKAGHSLAAGAHASPDVHHAKLLALGTVCGLLLAPVGKVGLGPATEALAGGGPHVHHVICLAPVERVATVMV